MLSWVRTLRSAAVGELRSLLGPRRGVLIMVLLGLPILYPTIISFMYMRRQADERPALLVDADRTSMSRALALALDATPEIAVVGRPSSLEEAFQSLRRQEAELLVYIPSDTSTRLARREQAHLKLWASTTNIYTYGLSYPALQDVVLSTSQQLAAEYLARKGVPTAQVRRRIPAISADVRQAFIPTGSYGAFLVPGVLLVVLQQIVLVSVTFSIGWQREDGVLPPAPRWPFAALLGRGLVHCAFHLAGAALIVFAVFPLFGWPLAHPWLAFAVFAALAVAILPPALLAAVLVTDRYLAFQLLMFFSAPVFMMSGFSYPLQQMPTHIQALAWVFPATPALKLLRAATVTGQPLATLTPWILGLLAQVVAWTVVAAVTSYLVRRRARLPREVLT